MSLFNFFADLIPENSSKVVNPEHLPSTEFLNENYSGSAVIPSLPLTIKWLRDCVKDNPSLRLQVNSYFHVMVRLFKNNNNVVFFCPHICCLKKFSTFYFSYKWLAVSISILQLIQSNCRFLMVSVKKELLVFLAGWMNC